MKLPLHWISLFLGLRKKELLEAGTPVPPGDFMTPDFSDPANAGFVAFVSWA